MGITRVRPDQLPAGPLQTMWSLSLEWMLLALLVFWAVGAYNRLARLRSGCVQQFGALDAHLGQWHAMLQAFEAQPKAEGQSPALVHAQAALHQTAAQLQAALVDARGRPLRETALASLEHACSALDVAWQAMTKVAVDTGAAGTGAAPPDAPSPDPDPLQPWQQRWTEHQVRNRLGLQQFNAAAERYNAAIAQYPARLLAWLLGFRPVRSLLVEPVASKAQESGT
ncbi:LemA protein [Delftia acidovorans]|nr:LemA protein [Delftia acidovorans]